MHLDLEIKKLQDDFFTYINKSHSILITSHKRPDDDSIASVLSIYYLLKEKHPEKNVRIIYSGEISQRWKYFKNFDKVETVNDISEILDQYDLVIFTDASESLRFSDNKDLIKNYTGKTICFEHHKNIPETFSLIFLESDSISTASIIYKVFLKDRKEIPQELAETIFMGVLGDSGNFRFLRPTDGDVLEMAKRLLEENRIDIQYLKSQYEKFSQRAFILIKRLIENNQIVDVIGWPKLMYSFLDRKFIEDNRFSSTEINEASHIFISMFGLSIEDITWAIVLYPLGDTYKASMRSLPNSVNVRILSQEMGIGGGHDRSGGGSLVKEGVAISHDEAFDLFLDWMSKNKPTLS